ncbi:FAD-dependent oxidoreductase [Telmatospirillum sp. J64-1]|uniref:FAD-dependent oxidoreductase n=1 Tax=Telmatospirillum sp. J64-1 TaxID=2502183 RepID=UPI00115EADD9|nr:FAD/NAD(P)-binding oxidoreductase [Telmatospirillum sp. J64-1]
MILSRRHFLAGGAGLAAAGLLPSPLLARSPSPLLPPPKGKRVVICGGGWGGVTAAKYMRLAAPDSEVVLLERNANFFSCPMSNKWLVNIVDAKYLMHDYLAPARKYGYTFIQTEVAAIERDRKTVITAQGPIQYDYLILAAGIGYDYGAWFGDDRAAAHYTRTHFPAAYIASAEHLTIKNKVQSFEGGDFVMTLPPPPHRCPPSPYERACLIAWHIKTNNIKGKVFILDPKPAPAPIGEGYRRAFEELYKDQIVYVPNARTTGVDPYTKTVTTAAGQFRFDDAILMAPHRAGEMVDMAGLIGRNKDGESTGWADHDPLYLHAKDDPNVFIIGDSVGRVSDFFGFYPKSGHVANRHARMATAHIARRMADKPLEKLLPDNLCFMMVNGSPREAISVQFAYSLDVFDTIEQQTHEIHDRDATLVEADFEWASAMYEDMFA